MMVMMLSLIKILVLMKNIIFLVLFAFVSLISCSNSSSPECEYLESMGKRGYDKNNQKIKELNIKISKCSKPGDGFLAVIDTECKERLLKEFNEQNNCNKQ